VTFSGFLFSVFGKGQKKNSCTLNRKQKLNKNTV